jgi:hypothetical protein
LEQLASWFDVEERDAGASLTRQALPVMRSSFGGKGRPRLIQDDEEIRQLGGFLWRAVDHRRRPPYGHGQDNVARHLWSMFGTRFRRLEQQFPESAERIRTAYV